LSGFQYSGVEQVMTFAAKDGTFFWSNGSAWGTCRLQKSRGGAKVELTILHGALTLKRFVVAGAGEMRFNTPRVFKEGKPVSFVAR